MTKFVKKKDRNEQLAIIISAPSGTGKTTIIKNLIEKIDDIYCSVSTTSRKSRIGEIDGLDYNFVSKEAFEQSVKEDRFFEYDIIYGNFYGTEKSQIDKALELNKDIIFDISWPGALQITKNMENICIFLLPPSLEELKTRLLVRGKDDEKTVNQRLKMVSEEVKESKNYDYIIINQDIEKTVEIISRIIKVERMKRQKNQENIQNLVRDLTELNEIKIDLK